jgi:HEAT repeat protein
MPDEALLYENEPISAWLSLLDHPEELQRRRAAQKLLDISAAIVGVLPALSGVLQNPDSSVRARAATVLGDIGARMIATLPNLRAALRTIVLTDSDAEVRASALQSLTLLGPDTQAGVSSLVASLKDELAYVRISSAHALGELGSCAKEAVPALTHAMLYDASPRVRLEAAVAIWRIDRRSVRVLPVLIGALQDPDEVSRWIAADCLGDIGPDAAEAIPALKKVLAEPIHSRLIRMSISLALERIDPAEA